MKTLLEVKVIKIVKTIRLPAELYTRLAKHARGFDTPAEVIERMVDFYEENAGDEVEKVEASDVALAPAADSPSKKYDKYVFEGIEYGKGRLVLAVITAHVKAHPGISLKELKAAFPKQLQGSRGVFASKDEAQAIFEKTEIKRHFINQDEVLPLGDAEVAVSSQWGSGNIDRFIQHAISLGYAITPKPDSGQGPA